MPACPTDEELRRFLDRWEHAAGLGAAGERSKGAPRRKPSGPRRPRRPARGTSGPMTTPTTGRRSSSSATPIETIGRRSGLGEAGGGGWDGRAEKHVTEGSAERSFLGGSAHDGPAPPAGGRV